jgi:hypothetical protein
MGIKALDVVRIFDEFSWDSDIGLWNMGVHTPPIGRTKASPADVRILMQSLNSARCSIKSSPRVPVLRTKVTAKLMERSFEFLLPVFNSCDNFGLRYSYVRNRNKPPRLVKHVLPGIVQSLVKLGAAQPIVTFSFQVQVIGNDRFPRNVGVADQRRAPSDSLLKRLDSRKEPVWVPKFRLLLES